MFISVTQHLNALKKVVGCLEHRTKFFLQKKSRDLSETFQPHVETVRIKHSTPLGHLGFCFVFNLNRFKRKNDSPYVPQKKYGCNFRLTAQNKWIRRFATEKARQTCFDDNADDVFTLLELRSDPVVVDQRRKEYCCR